MHDASLPKSGRTAFSTTSERAQDCCRLPKLPWVSMHPSQHAGHLPFQTVRYAMLQGGGKRKGAFAIYLEPWHADIWDWLDLRKNHGKEENRCRDLFYGLWVNDLFMEARLPLLLPLSASLLCRLLCAGRPLQSAAPVVGSLKCSVSVRCGTQVSEVTLYVCAAGGGGRQVEPVLPQRGARPGRVLGRRVYGAF